MRKYLLVLGIFFIDIDNEISGQELPAIQTDRPDQTECPFIVPVKHFQMESGFSYQHEDETTESYLYPSALFRYGVNSTFELRLITDLAHISVDDEEYSGLAPVTVGFKVRLAEENGIIPTTAFIGHLTFPKFASEDFQMDYYATSFRFTMQHTLTDHLTLSYNLGARWTGFGPEPVFLYTLTTGYSISEKVSCYIEAFGFAPQYSKAFHLIDGGFSYLLRNNMQLDISAGYRLTENAPEYYTALGFSFRIPD